jgi:hypothetical protein
LLSGLIVLGAGVGPLSASGTDPCSGQGEATLEVLPDSVAAPGVGFSIRLRGLPFAPFTLAGDVGTGPTTVPGVGTFCLDRGPRLRVFFDGIQDGFPVLPGDGIFTVALQIPPRRSLIGRTFHLQAAVQDPRAPNGFAISNLLSVTVRDAILENFLTVTARDDAATTATWTGDGEVRSQVSAPRTADVQRPESDFNLPDPLRTEGSRTQLLYSGSEIGLQRGESILGLSWGPKSNFVFASTYPDIEIKLGPGIFSNRGLDQEYDLSYLEPPVVVYRGDYTVPNSLDSPWQPWPQFTSDFDYRFDYDRPDGLQARVVVELSAPPGGDTYQLFRHTFTPGRGGITRTRNIGPFGSSTATNPQEITTYSMRFQVALTRTFAVSRFYDSGVASPDWMRPRGVGDLPPGTSIAIEVEGARDDDGDGQPDPGTASGFTRDVDAIDGLRLIRFRITLRGNVNAGTTPVARRVVIPYR